MQEFLKQCKYIEKKVNRYIIDDLESSSDDSDEDQIKAMRLIFSKKAISKIYFLKISSFRESNIEKEILEKCIF